MIYEFMCACGKRQEVARPVVDRNFPLACLCGLFMQRLLSRPAALITRRLVDEPEVKYAAGFSATDRLREVKEDDRRYARALAQKKEKIEPKNVDQIPSSLMADCMAKAGL